MGTRICMLVHQDYRVDGRVRAYSSFLKESPVDVDVICVQNTRQPAPNFAYHARIYSIPMKRFASGWLYLVEYTLALLFYTLLLTRLQLQNRYKVIHVHNMPDFLIFAAILPRLMGARLILDIHDPTPEFYMSKFGADENSLLVRALRLQEKFSIQMAHSVLTANENFRQNLIRRGIPPEKISVLYNVPDPSLFQRNEAKSKQEHFTLIYTGTLAPRYGLDTAIRAMPQLVQGEPGIRLRLVGSWNEYAEQLSELASSLGMSEYIRIDPAVPLEEIPSLMQNADAGIYPALPDAHMDIAVPTKVQEYAAMRLPIITSRLTVLEQIFPEDSVLYIPHGDPDSFRIAVLQLVQHPALRAELTRNAWKNLEKVRNWHREQTKYLGLLEKLSP